MGDRTNDFGAVGEGNIGVAGGRRGRSGSGVCVGEFVLVAVGVRRFLVLGMEGKADGGTRCGFTGGYDVLDGGDGGTVDGGLGVGGRRDGGLMVVVW